MGFFDFLKHISGKPTAGKAHKANQLPAGRLDREQLRRFGHYRALQAAGRPYHREGMPPPPRYTTN